MPKLIRLTALAAITTLGVVQAFAGVQSLPECYDRVISACNKGNHAQSCANTGMNECDKIFPTPMVLNPGLSLGSKPVVVAPVPLPRPAHLMVSTR
ncbi:MAG: hypothetical protein EOP21_08970 [Hyphomicrobiales bacterium]|nr:MAG: hypothetical protein EOP21_08970 [Hyphomicrobiales bacterium]